MNQDAIPQKRVAFHREITIDTSNPFGNCKLGREKYGKLLTQIVDTYSGGMVMAVNSRWGTGKTTFIKMWEQSLKNASYKTVYFNAWENDHGDEPLVAIISEFNKVQRPNIDYQNKLIKALGAILKNSIPLAARTLGNIITLNPILDSLVGTVGEDIGAVAEKSIDRYLEAQNSTQAFKTALKDCIAGSLEDKPLIFIIDELDRCRPNYAVKTLEAIKHLFSVEGIIFVLSIDKNHLEASVKGFYGSDSIDATDYLRRFIDFEFRLPDPDIDKFISYLFDYFEINKIEFKPYRTTNRDATVSNLQTTCQKIFKHYKTPLRQQERILLDLKIIVSSQIKLEYTMPYTTALLAILKHTQPDNYTKIKNGSFTLKEFSDFLSRLIENQDRAEVLKKDFYIETHLNYALKIGMEAVLIDRNLSLYPDLHRTDIYDFFNNQQQGLYQYERRIYNSQIGGIIPTICEFLELVEFRDWNN